MTSLFIIKYLICIWVTKHFCNRNAFHFYLKEVMINKYYYFNIVSNLVYHRVVSGYYIHVTSLSHTFTLQEGGIGALFATCRRQDLQSVHGQALRAVATICCVSESILELEKVGYLLHPCTGKNCQGLDQLFVNCEFS